MQIVNDLGKIFLCLVLTRNIREFDAVRGLDIHLGVALAHVEHHGVSAAGFFHYLPCDQLPDDDHHRYREQPRDDKGHERRGLFDYLTAEADALFDKSVPQLVLGADLAGLVYLLGIL